MTNRKNVFTISFNESFLFCLPIRLAVAPFVVLGSFVTLLIYSIYISLKVGVAIINGKNG